MHREHINSFSYQQFCDVQDEVRLDKSKSINFIEFNSFDLFIHSTKRHFCYIYLIDVSRGIKLWHVHVPLVSVSMSLNPIKHCIQSENTEFDRVNESSSIPKKRKMFNLKLVVPHLSIDEIAFEGEGTNIHAVRRVKMKLNVRTLSHSHAEQLKP